MCLIIHAPKGTEVPEVLLRSAYAGNSDGLGIMFWNEKSKSISINRTLPADVNEMLATWNKYKKFLKTRDVAIHFRLTTHGDTDKRNCHPYLVMSKAKDGRDIYLMHNGILRDAPSYDKSFSDTGHLVQYYIRPILLANPDIYEDTHFKDNLKHLSTGNRFLLLDGETGKFLRIDGGTFSKEVKVEGGKLWLSNSYSLSRTASTGEKLVFRNGELEESPTYDDANYYHYGNTRYTPTKLTEVKVTQIEVDRAIFDADATMNSKDWKDKVAGAVTKATDLGLPSSASPVVTDFVRAFTHNQITEAFLKNEAQKQQPKGEVIYLPNASKSTPTLHTISSFKDAKAFVQARPTEALKYLVTKFNTARKGKQNVG